MLDSSVLLTEGMERDERRARIYEHITKRLCEMEYAPPFVFAKEETGRPFLKGEGVPFFSVSHSGRFAAVSIADAPTGVDIEDRSLHRDVSRLSRIVRRFFHPTEAKRLFSDREDEAEQSGFLKLWTAKEALTKASSAALLQTLRACDLSGALGDTDACDIRFDGALYHLFWEETKEYCFCTCIRGNM